MAAAPASRPPGRPAAASREELLGAALARFVRGERIDVQAIAAELGLSRATVYRWHGSREGLIGEVLVRASEPLLREAERAARGRGAERLLDVFDRYNRSLADAPALRRFIENERGGASRILLSADGPVQPRMVALIREVIDAEVARGWRAPVETGTLAYAIVRLAEAFLYTDAAAGVRGDVDRLREVEAALLGVGRRDGA